MKHYQIRQIVEELGLEPLDSSFFRLPAILFYHINKDTINDKNQEVLAILFTEIENGLEAATKTSDYNKNILDSFELVAYILRNIQSR